MNQKKAGVILSYTAEAVQILSSLLYTPIMLRLLGQSEYGLYQLVHSVVAYLGLLSFGFASSYIRFYSIAKKTGNEDEIVRLNGMFMTIFLTITVIAALCGGMMVRNIHGLFGNGLTDSEYKTARILLILMVFNLCISFPNSVFNCIVSAHERFFFQRLLTLLQHLLNPFLTLPLLLMGYGSVGMVIITTLITVSKFLVNIWYSLRRLHARFIFNSFRMDLLKEMWIFTFFIFLNQIIDQINWSVDRFLLGRMIGTTAVAIYGLGGTINTMYRQFSTSISGVFAPQVNRIVAEGNDNHKLSILMIRIGRIQFMMLSLILSGFIFCGHPFMKIWGGAGYGDSYYVALWLIIPVTVPLIQNIGIEIQRAKNKHQARSIVYLCIAIVNILISIPLIRAFGPTGAAIGTAIALTVGNIIYMNWYYSHRLGLEIKSFWVKILSLFPALIIPAVIGAIRILYIPLNSIFSIFIFSVCYSIVFCASLWILGMNEYEKSLIKELIRKAMRKKHAAD